jgi:superfamily II DNA or RNA helicase
MRMTRTDVYAKVKASEDERPDRGTPAIGYLKFPFNLKKDQEDAVEAWIRNDFRGSIVYSTGTGKTEIAFECARRAAIAKAGIVSDIAINTDFKHNINNYDSDENQPVDTDNATPTTNNFSSTIQNDSDETAFNKSISQFRILLLVPRIVLIEQNVKRLIRYGILKKQIGVYFGEKKEVREITVSTYQSINNNLDILRNSQMIIFDEVHLIGESAKSFSQIFDVVVEDRRKAILGLTATIDENDPNFNTILSILPPVRKYHVKEAVRDGRLARPVILPIKVNLTEAERRIYYDCSSRITAIASRLNRFDAQSISLLLRKGGPAAFMAKTWFANVRKRRALLNCADNKILAAADIISKKHPKQRIMVFSETLESVHKLREELQHKRRIKSYVIESKLKANERQEILSKWGVEFYPLLSVHTLEIGYDVPEVGVAIILANTSNINQTIQRIGRVIRKSDGKEAAFIYAVYLTGTTDHQTLRTVKRATGMAQDSYDDADNEKTREISYSKRGKRKTNMFGSKQDQREPMTLDNYFKEFK